MKELIRRASEVIAEQNRLIAERHRLKLEITLRTRDRLQRHKRIFKWHNGIFYETQVRAGGSQPPVKIAAFASAISRKAIATLDFASAFLRFAEEKRKFAVARVGFADERRRFAAARLGFAGENPGAAI